MKLEALEPMVAGFLGSSLRQALNIKLGQPYLWGFLEARACSSLITGLETSKIRVYLNFSFLTRNCLKPICIPEMC